MSYGKNIIEDAITTLTRVVCSQTDTMGSPGETFQVRRCHSCEQKKESHYVPWATVTDMQLEVVHLLIRAGKVEFVENVDDHTAKYKWAGKDEPDEPAK